MEKLQSILLRPEIANALKYCTNKKEVSELINSTVQEIIKTRTISYPPKTVLRLLNEDEKFLSTGDKQIDRILGGGILSKGITEIVGESSVGKTQLSLQLCLTVQLPKEMGGLNGGVVYISTEKSFHLKRYYQMIPLFQQQYSCMKEVDLAKNVHCVTVSNLETQRNVLFHQLPILLSSNNIRLIIIDSITANFRGGFETKEFMNLRRRSSEIYQIGIKLKEISDKFNVPIVCVNQVLDNFTSMNTDENYFNEEVKEHYEYNHYQKQLLIMGGDGTKKIPALGLTWSNTINVRIVLSRPKRILSEGSNNDNKNPRTIALIMAPYAPRRFGEYYIDSSGIQLLTPQMMSGSVGYIGSKISLISRSDIRYVGILHSINSTDSTVALEQGRRGNSSEEIPPSDNVFEYIVFRGSDVKDLHVCEAPAQQQSITPQVPNDPAILGVRFRFAPPPPLGVQPPPNFTGASLNPFYLQQLNNLSESTAKEAEQPKSQQQKEHGAPDKVEDHKTDKQATALKNFVKTGTSTRSTASTSTSNNTRIENTKEAPSSSTAVAVENLAKKVSELSITPKETNGDKPGVVNNNRSTPSNNRLPGMGGHLVQQNRRARGGRRNFNPNYDRNRIPVPQSDFDFESSNAKFNKDELVKEVVKKIVPNHEIKDDESSDNNTLGLEEEEEDILIPPAESYYDKAKSFFDNISCETKERLEQQGPDGRRGLSVAERRQKQSEERRLNLETFGQVSIDGGRYRGGYRSRGYRGSGRGGYRGGRGNSGYRGGYSNNYRGNNYRVIWTEEMEQKLWEILTLNKRSNIDWNAASRLLNVPVPYLLRYAAFLYETQLRGVQMQLRLGEAMSSSGTLSSRNRAPSLGTGYQRPNSALSNHSREHYMTSRGVSVGSQEMVRNGSNTSLSDGRKPTNGSTSSSINNEAGISSQSSSSVSTITTIDLIPKQTTQFIQVTQATQPTQVTSKLENLTSLESSSTTNSFVTPAASLSLSPRIHISNENQETSSTSKNSIIHSVYSDLIGDDESDNVNDNSLSLRLAELTKQSVAAFLPSVSIPDDDVTSNLREVTEIFDPIKTKVPIIDNLQNIIKSGSSSSNLGLQPTNKQITAADSQQSLSANDSANSSSSLSDIDSLTQSELENAYLEDTNFNNSKIRKSSYYPGP
ncbi:10747_t:CDS:10 [Diversispora eburnea]|uniref:10747_t:CDS:1 n=1 Tax=Diversispora eburnea TaxID=1213867 RepID=A0A9N9BBL8_9GLOM|nr:10747_t:CDS:10 [Diversispora eburnea]